VQQALEMLLREYGPLLQIYAWDCSYFLNSVTPFSAQASCNMGELHTLEKINIIRQL
jgi:hypothetical protein